jgi:hypothetical protein
MDPVLKILTTLLLRLDAAASGAPQLVAMMMVFVILIGPLFMLALAALGKHLPWLTWRLMVIAALVLRDELVKAILLALMAAVGLAGVVEYLR